MKQPIIFMYSGQGSQYYQMGEDLYNNDAPFKYWMDTLDGTVMEISGQSIVSQLYDSGHAKDKTFDHTLVTHPAIFMVEYALSQSIIEKGIVPDFLLGASLGEYVAASVAGAVEYSQALDILIKQARLFDTLSLEGGMMAIVESPELFDNESVLNTNSELASVNYNGHFVVSGLLPGLEKIEEFLKNNKIIYQNLPVSHGFHSSAIDPAQSECIRLLQGTKFGSSQIPCISCLTTRACEGYDSDFFWQVVRKPVQFQKTMVELRKKMSPVYIDLGPSGTLANFTKYNFPEKKNDIYHVLTPFNDGKKNIEKIITAMAKSKVSTKNKKVRKRKNMNMKTWVFPGQGSQFRGMGEKLFDQFPELVQQADEILGYSTKKLCLEDPDNQLSQTKYTQPAVFVVNALSYEQKIHETGVQPEYLAGHSLGEYNAVLASGGFSFETGLQLVKERSRLMSKATGGAMAAILDCNDQTITEVLAKNDFDSVGIANFNAPSQIVISGATDQIEKAAGIFEKEGITFIPLNVSGAFHSKFMEGAQKEFKEFVSKQQFAKLNIPVISNVYAREYHEKKISDNLIAQITSPVKWTEIIRYLMGKGDMKFEEVGPGDVLTKLVDKIQREASPLVVEDEGKMTKPEKIDVIDNSNTVPLITAESLGCDSFKKSYGLRYAYLTGAMVRGIASKEMVVNVGKAGMMGFLGTGGMDIKQIESEIKSIQSGLNNGEAYGMNLLSNIHDPVGEEKTIDLYLKYNITNIEAAAYMQMSPALVRYRLSGLSRKSEGAVLATNKIMGKVSRPEVAELFLSPAPEHIVTKLVDEGRVTAEQADLAKEVPMADDLCAEADSGGHTDQGIMTVLLPTLQRLRDQMALKYNFAEKIRVGAAGGIGTPEAAAAAFTLGADFILTGSINQCTVEAGTSDGAKDILQGINIQDTDYAPAADLFEFGAKVQVVRKGVFFPARANKLYELYRNCSSLDEIDAKTKKQLEERYFKRSIDDVWTDTEKYFLEVNPQEVEKAKSNPKHKMALVFRSYLFNSMQLAMKGIDDEKVDFQIHCGPALGAFNQWVKGTDLEDWRNRHADKLGLKIMEETARILVKRYADFTNVTISN